MYAIVDRRNGKQVVTSESRMIIEAVYNAGYDEPLRPYGIECINTYTQTNGNVQDAFVQRLLSRTLRNHRQT